MSNQRIPYTGNILERTRIAASRDCGDSSCLRCRFRLRTPFTVTSPQALGRKEVDHWITSISISFIIKLLRTRMLVQNGN